MSKDYNEKTRVQMPALIHLTRLGYTYVGKLSHLGVKKNPSDTESESEGKTGKTSFDPDTNILLGEFQKAFARLNPDKKKDWPSVLEAIKKELNDDDLGKQFYKRLISVSKVLSNILLFFAFSKTVISFLIYAPLPFNLPVISAITFPSGVLTILSNSPFGNFSLVTTQLRIGIFLFFI